jgi:hypothetical protein
LSDQVPNEDILECVGVIGYQVRGGAVEDRVAVVRAKGNGGNAGDTVAAGCAAGIDADQGGPARDEIPHVNVVLSAGVERNQVVGPAGEGDKAAVGGNGGRERVLVAGLGPGLIHTYESGRPALHVADVDLHVARAQRRERCQVRRIALENHIAPVTAHGFRIAAGDALSRGARRIRARIDNRNGLYR